MSKLVQIRTEHGLVLFEVDDVPAGPERISRRGTSVVAELDERLETALASARPAAQAVVDAFTTLSPDECVIEFGLRIDAEAGAVIAKTGMSGHFTISLKWSRADETEPSRAET